MDNPSKKDKSLLKRVTAKSSKKKDKTKQDLHEAGTNEARTSIPDKTRTRPDSVYELKPITDVLYYWQKKDVKELNMSGKASGMNVNAVDGNIYETPEEEEEEGLDYATINEGTLGSDSLYTENKQLARHDRRKSVNQTTQDVCDDYGTMVTIFKSVIVKKVIIGQLLPHLTFIEDPLRWYSLGSSDPTKAMHELIGHLLFSRELGKWKQFVEALERCGYSFIVQNIKGYKVIDSEYQEKYLRILNPLLRGMIDPMSILPHLCAKHTINDDDKEEIASKEKNVGKLAAADMLLDRVPRKHALWYQHLLESFKETRRDDIAEYLDIPEMMIEVKQSKHACSNEKRSENDCTNMNTNTRRVSESDAEPKQDGIEFIATLQRANQSNTKPDQQKLNAPPPTQGVSVDEEHDELLENIYGQVHKTSQMLSRDEQMLDRIETREKNNDARKLEIEKRTEKYKRRYSQNSDDTLIRQGTTAAVKVEESEERQYENGKQNGSKTFDL